MSRGVWIFAVLLVCAWAAGCGDDVSYIDPDETGGMGGIGGSGAGGAGGSGGTGGSGGVLTCTAPAERVDLLLTIDNSRSMADKQEILGLAVPDLVHRLVNPPCVDGSGQAVSVSGPLDDCPDGYQRQFEPVLDLHLGVISSSLGDHGGDVCPEATGTNNDLAHLLSRDAQGASMATYQDLGFLAWDPTQALSPPGETDLTALTSSLQQLVLGAGEVGCGFEAQLESWYRFLVDPDPWASVVINPEGSAAVLEGSDALLLQQRRDFLRPDSLLLILMLSDEDDCSIRDGGQYFYAAKATAGAGTYHLPRAQITCQTDPADPCCRSCGQSDDGCPPKGPECATAHDNLSDAINLRCFDQKRRFGIDFLYPMERYVDGLSSPTVPDRMGNLLPNPIFSDLDPNDAITAIRGPELVFVAGIVGVPWQNLARLDGSGQPDLLAGLDGDGSPVGGYKTAVELMESNRWPTLIGDPEAYQDPADPHMVSSVEPRSGSNPITGDAIALPNAGYMANPINGHERTIAERDDLQYACIFPLAQPRDCSADPMPPGCDCIDTNNNNPLCQDPSGQFGTTQTMAKAYPSIRELWLLRMMGSQGITGSICPAQIADPNAADYGYRPSVQTILEQVQQCL